MKNLTLSRKIMEELYKESIDTEVSVTATSEGVKTLVELSDLATGTPIGVLKGDTLEDALASLYAKFAAQVRDIKTGGSESKLTDL